VSLAQGTTNAEGLSKVAWAAFAALVAALSIAPLVAVQMPPLHDYPFHLARADIIRSLESSSFTREHYEIGTFLLPNVGMDLVMFALTAMLPIATAGRVFLGLTLILTLGGVAALHYVLHRRLSAWPFLAAFLLYNWIFLLGFLNYLLGVALMLWSVAAWLAMRDTGAVLRITCGALLGVGLLFCHLTAVGLFAIIVGGFELQAAIRHWRERPARCMRDLAVGVAPFLVVLATFALLSPASGEIRQPFVYPAGLTWKPQIGGRSLLSGSYWLDAAILLPIAAAIVFAAWRRSIRVATTMLLPLLLTVLAFIALPHEMFDSNWADTRLPIAIVLVAIASTSPHVRSTRLPMALCAAAVLLLAVRSTAITADWIRFERVIEPFRAAFARLPDESTVLAASAMPLPLLAYRSQAELGLLRPPLKHVMSLASLSRPIFVPATWADPAKQPIRVTARFAAIRAWQTNNPKAVRTGEELAATINDIAELRRRLAADDPRERSRPAYLLLLHPAALSGSPPTDQKIVARGEHFALLRLE